jgi:putative tryptophan/tyrosine transport system substrate-binding protein
MRRRTFITLLGGAAAAWPLGVHAQQGERMRRVGVLTGIAEYDPETKARNAAFLKELERLGWIEGQNIRIEYRSAAGSAADGRRYAAELVALNPDVILATGTINLDYLLQETRTTPIVFTIVADPVGSGLVESMSEPGGNATGFMTYEYSLAGKWLELLKQLVPGVRRAAVFRDSALPHGSGQFAVIQSVAPLVGVEVRPINARNPSEIEQGIAKFARSPDSGLIVTASPSSVVHRDLLITLASRHKLPTIWFERFFVAAGGLVSYGPNLVEQFRDAAGYVDRILKGARPADLPVQAPTNYELVINLKTAKALGIDVPATVLARANEIIE